MEKEHAIKRMEEITEEIYAINEKIHSLEKVKEELKQEFLDWKEVSGETKAVSKHAIATVMSYKDKYRANLKKGFDSLDGGVKRQMEDAGFVKSILKYVLISNAYEIAKKEINSNVGIGEPKRSLIKLLDEHTSRRAGETIRVFKKQDKS